jgi:hypothetical protein
VEGATSGTQFSPIVWHGVLINRTEEAVEAAAARKTESRRMKKPDKTNTGEGSARPAGRETSAIEAENAIHANLFMMSVIEDIILGENCPILCANDEETEEFYKAGLVNLLAYTERELLKALGYVNQSAKKINALQRMADN